MAIRLSEAAQPPVWAPAEATPLRKVLLIYQDFGAMGGIERYLIQTASLLKAGGRFEPVVACCESTPLFGALQAAGIRVYGLSNRSVFARSIFRMLDFPTWRRIQNILDVERPHLVHVHIGLLENLWLKRWGYPVVYTVHGYGTLYSLQGVRSAFKKLWKCGVRWLFRQTMARMDAVLFVSRAEQTRLQAEGFAQDQNPSRDSVLPNGIAVADWQSRVAQVDEAEARQTLNLPPDARCVSFINRLDANKNPLQFVALARQLASAPGLENVHFLMAGDGPLLQAVRQAGADVPRLHLLGHQADVAPVLAVSELIVYPSRQEAFGLGLLEAMSAGIPVVAYASGGARTLLDTPETQRCLVPVDDTGALCEKVRHTLSLSPAERQIQAETLQARAACFDSARFIERLEAVYQRLAPNVSVILPVYQGEQTVLRAVRSVLGQTYPHLELIVVDDGSTDGTLKRLATVNDPRLKVLRQPNQGVAAARNLGFAHATGDYVACIDADDGWLPEKLATELDVIRRAGVEAESGCLVYSGYYALDEENRLSHLPPVWKAEGDLSQRVLAEEGIFLPSTSLVHRRVWEAVGGFKPDCYHEDRVFFIEACRRFPAYATGKRLVLYQQSSSGRCRRVLQDFDTALQAELSITQALQESLAPDELRMLSLRQQRNLLYRFLMYGYLGHARRIWQRIQQAEEGDASLLTGKKGVFAMLSLKANVNFLYGARLFMQAVLKAGLAPWWVWKSGQITQ